MSLKEKWRPRVDGVDDADSSAVNEIAEAVIELEENIPKRYYSKEISNNLFANALKGSASGEVVSLKDVSPVEHNLGVTISGVDNPEAVKVRVQGKNLFDGVWESGIIGGTNGANLAVDGYTRAKNYIPVVYGEKYVFSNCIDNTVNALVYEYTEDFTYNLTTNLNIALNKAYTPSKPTTKYIRFRFNIRALALDAKAQLEIGATATEYEPYKEPIEYTVSPDGTVDGVKSIAPATTLTTDTEGVLIEVEYNKDANKVVASLEQRLAALESAIVSQ